MVLESPEEARQSRAVRFGQADEFFTETESLRIAQQVEWDLRDEFKLEVNGSWFRRERATNFGPGSHGDNDSESWATEAVLSGGVNFFRFESVSGTDRAVGAFGAVNPRKVDGLAGKYRQGFGTPFDLQDLEGAVGLDISAVKYVRIVDVVGGTSLDSTGGVIYDPWPGSGAAGFDLDAVAVLGVVETRVLSTEIVNGECVIRWESVPGEVYEVERSACLGEEGWALVEEVEAFFAVAEITLPLAEGGVLFSGFA